LNQIEIRFTYLDNQEKAKGSIQAVWNVKNNSNITMGEVLDGLAVFVFDESNALNHIGKTPYYVTEDRERYFDFVQELLNQVVPRKRSVGNLYSLLEEDGIFTNDFGSNTVGALNLLKEHFQIDSITNAQWDFTKLMRDYNIPEADYLMWSNRIVDKRTLAGDTLRVEGQVLDNQINPSITQGDTGLYELYVNVVKVFINKMVEEGQRYVNDTTTFKSRTGSTEQGVSYCFGSNDDLIEYQNNVSGVTFAPTPVPANYRGDVGGKQYAGLIRDEWNIWDSYFINKNISCNPVPPSTINQVLDHKLYPQYWAGVDCSAFIQIMANHADPNINPGNGVPPVNPKVLNLADYAEICTANRRELKRTYSGYYFEDDRDITKHIAFDGLTTQQKEEKLKLLKKGDLIHYSGHISMVYSERALMVGDQARYQIIHAYGRQNYDFNDNKIIDPGEFSRKVVITRQDAANPIGFGRIKLW
jgi:hypothetical protein